MNDTDHLFLTRAEIRQLVTMLQEIPELVEDLAITITRQDRIVAKGGPKLSRGSDEQPLVFNVNASEVADDLHGTLVGWVRHVCESRAMAYEGHVSTLSLARWLDRHVISLAMTEGSEEALDEISYAMRRARRAMDLPRPSKVLFTLCVQCGSRVEADAESESATCQTCGRYSTITEVREVLDENMDGMILSAKEVAAMIAIRYGVSVKPKTVYDMAYRKNDPIATVALPDGTSAFPLGLVIADLRQKGKIA
ncbi:hypothetical protein [Rhodococcus marinonascens]|uniref:hypothetical protein n=1 Tax=Rhodococcus marinonascens TaxID=38311 RepID=UPI000935579D|nr:hypothetical protein [Rhodococcus marinonascens]